MSWLISEFMRWLKSMLITPLCPCLGRREFLSVAADAINARATDDGSVIVKKQEQKQDAKKPT